MIRVLIFVVAFIFVVPSSYGQRELSLNNVIQLAQKQSLRSKKVVNSLDNNYWRFFSYKKSLLPSLSFNGTLPDINIGISEVILPNGTSQFVRRSQTNYTGVFTLNQAIPWTGGNLFVSSGLSRLDLHGDFNTTSYRSSPFYVGYRQPIFQFNPYKWRSSIEPLYYEEAKKLSVEEKEDISIEAVNLFFGLINNLSRFDVAKLNVANSDTLFRISQGRYNLGKIAETDLLQMELTLLNAKKELVQTELDVKLSRQRLKSFLAIPISEDIALLFDKNIPKFHVDVEKAVDLAKKHRSEMVKFKRNELEGERELDRVKKNNSFNADMFISVGTTQTGTTLENSYVSPLDQERISMGINIPIFNWGVSRANIKQQKANFELVKNQVEQDKIDFVREIFIQTTQFNLMNQQVEISHKSMIVAMKRYELAKQRYLIGKSDIFTFNNSLKERNEAINSYNRTLQQYWSYYYLIRKLTHYDFELDKEIGAE